MRAIGTFLAASHVLVWKCVPVYVYVCVWVFPPSRSVVLVESGVRKAGLRLAGQSRQQSWKFGVCGLPRVPCVLLNECFQISWFCKQPDLAVHLLSGARIGVRLSFLRLY